MRPTRIVLPTPFAVGPVNAYVFPMAPVTLIDPGPLFPPAQEALAEGLRRMDIRRADIQRVVVTHHHPDHSGFAPQLARETGADVWAHEHAIARMRDPFRGMAAEAALLGRHGVPETVIRAMNEEMVRIASFVSPVGDVQALADGDLVDAGGEELMAMLVPGHAPGHLAFVAREFTLSGDAVIDGITPNPVLEMEGAVRRKTLPEYVESLHRLEGLEERPMLPGHRGEIKEPAQLLSRYLQQIDERGELVLAALGSRTVQAFALSQEFFPMSEGKDPFLALSEILGHLDLLLAKGFVEEREEAGRILYRRT